MSSFNLDFLNIVDVNGSHTELVYSKVGQKRLWYAASLVDCRQLDRFLFTKLRTLDTLDTVLFICAVKDIGLSSITPKQWCWLTLIC